MKWRVRSNCPSPCSWQVWSMMDMWIWRTFVPQNPLYTCTGPARCRSWRSIPLGCSYKLWSRKENTMKHLFPKVRQSALQELNRLLLACQYLSSLPWHASPALLWKNPSRHFSHWKPVVLFVHLKHSPVKRSQLLAAFKSKWPLQWQRWQARWTPLSPKGSP